MTRGIFTEIADVYDRMNHLLSLGLDRRWRRLAAESAKGSPARVLDLACGTGDFAFELARRFPGAEVVGVDITPAMLDIARGKDSSGRVRFEEGDASDLSALSPGSFGLCSCAFGFRNFPDRRRALGEARRVLEPGGELLVLEFFRPESAVLGFLTSAWLRLLAAVLVPCRRAAYRYLRESMGRMDTADGFAAQAREQGFRLEGRRFFLPCCTCLRLVADTTTL